ncbi:MAG: hypothetical protein PHG64_15045 [Paludibacter sp.]|nr:hypothetical protein [Paludibacter sp.]
MKDWFTQENTEGFDENELAEMNAEMQKKFDSLTEKEKQDESYIAFLEEEILSKY